MGRHIGSRIVAVIGGIIIFGIALRLIGGILKPVLPAVFWRALNDGWNLLYGMVSPAVAAIAAAGILAAICWVVIAWLRRN